jgi:hypothetical protein
MATFPSCLPSEKLTVVPCILDKAGFPAEVLAKAGGTVLIFNVLPEIPKFRSLN